MKRFFLFSILFFLFWSSNLHSQLKNGGRTHDDSYFSVAVNPSYGIATSSSYEAYHGFDLNLETRVGKSIGDGNVFYGNLIMGYLFGNLLAADADNMNGDKMPDDIGFNQITLGGGFVSYSKKKSGYYSLSLGATNLLASQTAPKTASNYLGLTANFRFGFEKWLSNNTSFENGIGLSYSHLFSTNADISGSMGLIQIGFYFAMTID